MAEYISTFPLYSREYLAHWGIPGMKWGVRRYQNKDGTLTPEGRIRYEKPKEQLRNRVIEHPRSLYKNKSAFTREELEDILKNIEFDRRLKDVKRTEFNRTVETIKNVATLATSVKKIGEATTGSYDSYKDISDILHKRDRKKKSKKSEKS